MLTGGDLLMVDDMTGRVESIQRGFWNPTGLDAVAKWQPAEYLYRDNVEAHEWPGLKVVQDTLRSGDYGANTP